MWGETLSQLEEGKYKTFVKQCTTYYRLRHHPAARWYCLYLAWFAALVSLRPQRPTTGGLSRGAPVRIGDHAQVYASMVSKEVDTAENALVAETSQRLIYAMEEQHFECLAAVHLGVPIQLIRLTNATLLNPSIIEHGTTLSKAYETSAFFPERKAILVTRFVPIVVEYLSLAGTLEEVTLYSTQAHCVLHLMNQFAGRTIYD